MINGSEPSPRTAEDLFGELLEREREGRSPQVDDLLADAAASVREEFDALREDYLILRRQLTTGALNLTRGARLGGFLLLRPLGSGGMGVVWEALQEGLGRSVALKVLHPHLLLSERAVERFRREAEAGGRLRHPALVLVHAVGMEEGVSFLAQELLEGGSLADRIAALRAADARLSDQAFIDVARSFARLAEGVSAAHEAGIIHRDIKPSNVLFDRDGNPKLGDFGLATAVGGEASALTGEITGTIAYASPEQLRGGRSRIDSRTDVYSLGVSLFEALTLRRPFEGDAAHILIRRILQDEPPDPRGIRSRIPRDLALVCLRAMEKSPALRYGSARELADDLGRFLRHEPVLARPVGPMRRILQWCRRRPALAGLIGVTAAALVVVSLLLLQLDQARAQVRFPALQLVHLLAREQEQGHFDLAEDGYRSTISAFSIFFGGDSEHVLVLRRGLAILHLRDRRFEEASHELEELLPLLDAHFGRAHEESLVALRAQTEVLHATGSLPEAQVLILEQIERIESMPNPDRMLKRIALHYLATNAAAREEWGEYVDARKRQLDLYDASDSKGRAAARCAYAEALITAGSLAEAESRIEESSELLGDGDRGVLMARSLLAAARKDWRSARDGYERAERALDPSEDPLGELQAVLDVRKALVAAAETGGEAEQEALRRAQEALPPQLVEWRLRKPQP